MEKSTKNICQLLPHACSLGLSEPKAIAKPEVAILEPAPPVTDKPIRKPWTVFEGVYWL